MRKLTWAGLTDVGRKRSENEDAYVVDPELGIYIVCDGMGGHASGEVASAMTTEEVHAFFANRLSGDLSLPYPGEPGATINELTVSNAVQHANDKVYVAAMRDSKLEGMGTTVVGLVEMEDELILVHVGDSRIYRFRDGQLEQVTRDHSLLNHKIDLGELTTQEEIDNFKHGNVIVRAIGLKDYVRPETSIHPRVPGDIYLLCSDGLSDMVDDWSIENVLAANPDDLEEACQLLVRMANDRGGKDNITCVIVRIDDEPDEGYADEQQYEYDDYEEGAYEEEAASPLRHESTAPGRKAFDDDEDEGELEEAPAAGFKEFTEEDDDRTAPHAPVFAWDDEDEEDPPPPQAATRPAPRPQPPARP
ncbi:MAG TPA: Stp1/IreP family PP2C-type Ser/Thr phosphatase, partial [Myxococcota bacterium]|nr:Stp1/IreP family PP2C-type Ser/Thr phosphatase [Myxococcota bacterium]